jgi:hypothetical protein
MTEIRRKNLPMVVTLINLHDLQSSTVLLLEGISPKNYKGRPIYRLRADNAGKPYGKEAHEPVPGHPELVDKTANSDWTYSVEKYWLIQGRRFDLVEIAHKCIADYRAACDKRSRDKVTAEREFEKEWGEKNPYPVLADARQLIEPHLVDHMAST